MHEEMRPSLLYAQSINLGRGEPAVQTAASTAQVAAAAAERSTPAGA